MSKIKASQYSLGEEIINAISHGLGVALGIVALVLTVVTSAKHHSPVAVISSSIYGSTMIIMYLISCLYHSLSYKLRAKKVFRILDHCAIYLFIAGSCMPYSLCAIGGTLGWTIFGITWTCAIVGIVLNAINLEKFKKISIILYLVMGWLIMASYNTLKVSIALPGIILLISGGVVYTIGAILYLIGKREKYFHSIFHFFILAGSILQFLSILIYVV